MIGYVNFRTRLLRSSDVSREWTLVSEKDSDAKTESAEASTRWDIATTSGNGLEPSSSKMGNILCPLAEFILGFN